MRKLKTFVFKSGESETEMDKRIDDWVTKSKATIVSVQSSINSRPEASDCSDVLITLVYE